MFKYVALTLMLGVAANAAEFDYNNLSTMGRKADGTQGWIKCPVWDWNLVPPECRVPAFNCVPRCGKWPGDKWDIGAYEYVPGMTGEKPWGNWKGVPFSYVPGEDQTTPPTKFRLRER